MNGIILGNRYELLEKIGEGGMSEVFKARCNKLNRLVAVKILKKEFCNNSEIVQKFKGEATAIATLSDNNIVNILDVGTQEDINYIVMELVQGKTLKDVINSSGKMNYEIAISTAIQIAKALDCAHRNKIIHRDVKPQNILVSENGAIKVTDFGIAKSTSSATITNTSTIMGSAHYLSPEQAKGSFIDCRTDLYSLGVVLYEMVTGALPFEADTAVTIALKHLQEEAVSPKSLNSKIPDSLNKLILKCMEKDPNKRYQSAKEVIKDLQKIKENPNAIIDKVVDDQHTIIMSAVTEEISKQSSKKDSKNEESEFYDDDYDDEEYDYDDEEAPKKSVNNKKAMKLIIAIGGVVLLIALVVGIVTFFSATGIGKEVEIPDIVGSTIEDAKTKLTNIDLVLVEAGTDKSDKPEGTILEIDPKAGTKVKTKSKVRVIVSSGETKLKMPDLREDDLDTAKKKLESLKLKIDSSTEEYNDDISKGQIIKQQPNADAEITTSTKITVVVSKGPQIRLSTVPNVTGLSSDEAKTGLEKARLRVSTVEKVTENEAEDGKVLAQSIDGNSKVEQGTTVNITVGKYVKPKENPVVKPEETPGTTTPNTPGGTTPNTPGTTPPTNPNEPTPPVDSNNKDKPVQGQITPKKPQ
ncbi:Stk1 family PASTA domain-containing Ser/Thr kinase [Clostridium uliginosum]|uniref:non-specific serine/threonine protein kinase n=1 Tax=Clostridium uliginosum TaxID=119641 RepID=A0A1I1LQG5_9CLOT|nr:Stk1 family PASTA domain-containing Ser/Thr kinase [Clostridium uliginosum]SFC72543.1 serine/threonine protein kinase [Clostridium uliginosum]